MLNISDITNEQITSIQLAVSREAIRSYCAEAGLEVTPTQVAQLFAVSDVTTQEPFTAFGRLGLAMVQEATDV